MQHKGLVMRWKTNEESIEWKLHNQVTVTIASILTKPS